MRNMKTPLAIRLARRVRAVTPRVVRTQLKRAGDFFGRSLSPDYPSVESTLEYLKSWGFQPSGVIDIGAYHGNWTRMFKTIFPNASLLMIEAQSSKSDILASVCAEFEGDVRYEIAVLGAQDGAKVRFVEMGTGSSVFEESSPYHRQYIDANLTTLDHILEGHLDFQSPNFLKLDVQGYELEVLNGATATLQRLDFVFMETSLIPINRNAPLISDVIAYMASGDFMLFDFCSQIRRRDGALWQTDLLFIKNGSQFVPKPLLDSDNWW